MGITSPDDSTPRARGPGGDAPPAAPPGGSRGPGEPGSGAFPDDALPVLLARPHSQAYLVAIGAGAAALLAASLFVLVGVLVVLMPAGARLVTPSILEPLALPPRVVGGTFVGLGIAVLAGLVWLVRWGNRRSGRCLLSTDGLLFNPGEPQGVLLTFEEIDERRLTPHGIEVVRRGDRALRSWFFPRLVPTRDEAEQARVLATLDRLTPAPDAARDVTLRPRWRDVGSAQAMYVLVLSLVMAQLVSGREPRTVSGSLLHFFVPAVAWGCFLRGLYTVLLPRLDAVRLLPHTIMIGTSTQVRWRDVTLLVLEPKWLVVGTAQATWWVYVAGRGERLSALLRDAPVPVPIQRERPAWVVLAQRRWLAFGLALAVIGLAAGVGAAFLRVR